jgi:23S rRNA (pseudouridine1915-N3)-methyltransferase
MIRILAVGKIKDKQYAALIDTYLKRARPWAANEVIELKDQDPEREGRAMVDKIGSSELVIALDEKGTAPTSRQFAKLLASRGSITFLIGGPDGLGEAARTRADRTVRLSAMTLPHELARLVLAEQIYRGLSINKGHSYHRD